MELASVMPHITAEAMRSQMVDIEKHPYAAELLLTILLYTEKAFQAKHALLAIANIRSMTDNRLYRSKDAARIKLYEDHKAFVTAADGTNHFIRNPRRWKPATFLLAVRNLCETELSRRGFTWQLIEKTKRQKEWQIQENRPPARYWILELTWA